MGLFLLGPLVGPVVGPIAGGFINECKRRIYIKTQEKDFNDRNQFMTGVIFFGS